MKKTILFVILEKYADWESGYLSSLILALGRGNYSVKTVSLTTNPIQSMGGFTVIPDYDIQSAPTDFEGLILIGGMSWRIDQAQQVKHLVKIAIDANKVLGGICDGASFLGTLGVLNNVRHTCNDLNDLKHWAKQAYKGENNYVLQQAVRDKNIITANGTATLEFTKEILSALEIAPEKNINEWYDFYKLGCYKSPMPNM